MKILKFGGTSLGTPQRMRHIAHLIGLDQGRQLIVLSAIAGTTDALVKIGEACFGKNKDKVTALVHSLYRHYTTFIEDLFETDRALDQARSIIDECFFLISQLVNEPWEERFQNQILAQGELLSTKIFNQYLRETGTEAVWLPALEFMMIDEHKEPVLDYIRKNIIKLVKKYPDSKIFITQGFICKNDQKEIDNLKRGGSDYTATLLGAALEADEIQIWTDIDGMHNNDPRIVKHTAPIVALSFDEAAELAYFGAKILHPASVWPAQKYNIPLRLLHTMQPQAEGTFISAETHTKTIKAVAAKDGITAIKIKSGRMLLAYGFLKKVFEIFEKYKTPIDMITTSEVAVSLTIDDQKHLEAIIADLQLYGEVSVDKDQTIICIVGNMVANEKGVVKDIFNALEDIPVRMISYGGSKHNISVLIHSDQKHSALNSLNKRLFEN